MTDHDVDLIKKLTSLLRLMDSDFASERENAVHQAKRLLNANNMTWRDFTLVLEAEEQSQTIVTENAPKTKGRWGGLFSRKDEVVNQVRRCKLTMTRAVPIGVNKALIYFDATDESGEVLKNIKTIDVETIKRVKEAHDTGTFININIVGSPGNYSCFV